jgi:hypothetical protein
MQVDNAINPSVSLQELGTGQKIGLATGLRVGPPNNGDLISGRGQKCSKRL